MAAIVKTSNLMALAAALVLLQACESLIHGTSEEISITTTPTGAMLVLSDGQRCTTPCRLTVARSEILTVTATKTGCRPAYGQLEPGVTEEATLFGSVYDYRLGGAYRLGPNPLSLTLICGKAAQLPPPGLTEEERELIRQFGTTGKTDEIYPLIQVH